MKHKYSYKRLIVVFYLCLSLLVFWPISDIVNADAYFSITFENWDDFATGTWYGTGDYGTFNQEIRLPYATYGAYNVSADYAHSGSNSMRGYHGYGNLDKTFFYNFTSSFGYINSVSIYFRLEYGGTGENRIQYAYFYLYNNSQEVNKFRIYLGSGTNNHYWVQAYDYDNDPVYLYTSNDNSYHRSYYVTITHTSTNMFNYSVYNSTNNDFIGGQDVSGRNEFNHATYTQLRFQHSGEGLTSGFFTSYMDDVKINYSSSSPVTYGSPGYLFINTYDETTGSNITNFNVLAVNSTGHSLWVTNLNNTVNLSTNILPQGNDVMVTISALGYYSRTYTLDIYDGYFYVNGVYYTYANIEAYLPDVDLSYLYYLQVVDDYLYPVEDARVEIFGYVGDNTTYTNVSNTLTDGYGYTNVYLCFGTQYYVTLSKSGYDTKTESWTPDASKYGIEYPKVFKIHYVGVSGKQWDSFMDNITFTLDLVDAGYEVLGNLTINYADINTSTVNTEVYIYELYNNISTLINYSYNTTDTFNLNNKSINTSRDHYAILFFNNTADFSDIVSPYTVYHNALYTYGGPTIPSSFDDRVITIVGPDPFGTGWHTILAVGIGICMLVVFGPYNAGVGIIGCGLSMGLTDALFTSSFPVMLVTITPLVVAIGVIYIIVKGGAAQI